MKEPMTGRWGRTIGQGCQYVGVSEVRDAYMGDKRMKGLLPHRINRPSHILRQSMCVAHLVCVRWCFCRRTYTRVLSAPGRVPFLMWKQVWKWFTRGASVMMQSPSSGFGLRTNGTGMREKPIPARKNPSDVTPASFQRPICFQVPNATFHQCIIEDGNLKMLTYCTRITTNLYSVDQGLCMRSLPLYGVS